MVVSFCKLFYSGFIKQDTKELNWDCPCVGWVVSGPCGYEFRKAFECSYYSKDETHPEECGKARDNVVQCMRDHPHIFGRKDDGGDSGLIKDEEVASRESGRH